MLYSLFFVLVFFEVHFKFIFSCFKVWSNPRKKVSDLKSFVFSFLNSYICIISFYNIYVYYYFYCYFITSFFFLWKVLKHAFYITFYLSIDLALRYEIFIMMMLLKLPNIVTLWCYFYDKKIQFKGKVKRAKNCEIFYSDFILNVFATDKKFHSFHKQIDKCYHKPEIQNTKLFIWIIAESLPN